MAREHVWVACDDHSVATHGHILVQVWRCVDGLAHYDTLVGAPVRALVDAHPGGFVNVTIIEGKLEIPPARVRHTAVGFWDDYTHATIASAVIIPGKSALARAVRTTTNSMMLLFNAKSPARLFEGADSALLWLRQQCAIRSQPLFDVADVAAFIQTLRTPPFGAA